MVVTLHDLIALKRPGERQRFGMRMKLHLLAAQRATRVIVPTTVVADDAMHTLGIASDRLVVVPEAAATVFYPRSDDEVAAVHKKYGLPEDYLLWVGSLKTPEPHKRVVALARAKQTLPLVLVGRDSPWARELPGVMLTGEVPDEHLAAIYTGAKALVMPSADEGFGLTPIEALACGTPVAACDVPALREVLDGHAELWPCDDLDGLLASAEAASRPAPTPLRWSWMDAAQATWNVYGDASRAPALVG
ncbi:MAG: glycosyltransferase family 4 protein [Solirubrobacteraceae bacterium]